MDHNPSIDFSTYTDKALEDASVRIDRYKFPANFKSVQSEISRRKKNGTWDPVELSSVEVQVEIFNGEHRVVMPASLDPVAKVFLALWFPLWLLAEIHLVGSYFSGSPVHSKSGGVLSENELLFVVGFWTIAGWGVLAALIWSVFGKKIITVSKEAFVLTDTIRNFETRKRSVPLNEMDGLRSATVKKYGRTGPYFRHVLQIVAKNDQINLADGLELRYIEKLIEQVVEIAKLQGVALKLLEPLDER